MIEKPIVTVCPSCLVHHEQKPLDVDVTYCPKCGVPCFFPAGHFPMDGRYMDPIACVHCFAWFPPAQGGGVEVVCPVYGGELRFQVPRGILHNRRLML